MSYVVLFLLAAVGPVFPVVNTEALVVLHAGRGGHPAFVALAATAGQTAIFVALFLASDRWLAKSKRIARRLAEWDFDKRERFRRRATLFLVAGAVFGVPPFVALSILAGTIHYPLGALALISFVGRALRFGAIAWTGESVVPWFLGAFGA